MAERELFALEAQRVGFHFGFGGVARFEKFFGARVAFAGDADLFRQHAAAGLDGLDQQRRVAIAIFLEIDLRILDAQFRVLDLAFHRLF